MTSVIRLLNVEKSFGSVRVLEAINISVERGEFVSLLGPSGCGKTTTLRCIAGLESPTAGEITIGDACVFSSRARINEPPERRRLGMVFQSYAVWPHLSVAENVGYGLRAKGMPRRERASRVSAVLDMVGLQHLEHRNPTELSGGQQQRVALARSLVIEPEVLLLDEPLSNLDAKLRERMRFELKDLQRRLGVTTVFVTHDHSEALALSDRVIVMEAGRVVQQGSSAQIYRQAQSRFVLDFVGQANFLDGEVVEVNPSAGFACLAIAGGSRIHGQIASGHTIESGTRASVAILPEHIAISRMPIEGANILTGQTLSCLFLGSLCEVLVQVGDTRLKAKVSSDQDITEGERVWLKLNERRLTVLPLDRA